MGSCQLFSGTAKVLSTLILDHCFLIIVDDVVVAVVVTIVNHTVINDFVPGIEVAISIVVIKLMLLLNFILFLKL